MDQPLRPPVPGFGAAAIFVLVLSLPAAAAQDQGARAVVQGFHDALLEVMKSAESLGIKGRFRRLEPRVAQSFHPRLMVAIATGRYWRRADAAQRKRLTDAFTRFSAATYASRFASYSGESFEVAAAKPGPRGTALVVARIVRSNDSPVAITYVLKRFTAAWRIVDVVVEGGISELAVRRAEYARTLKRGGVEALIAALNQKADRLIGK